MIRFAAFQSVECATLVIAGADGAILHGDLTRHRRRGTVTEGPGESARGPLILRIREKRRCGDYAYLFWLYSQDFHSSGVESRRKKIGRDPEAKRQMFYGSKG